MGEFEAAGELVSGGLLARAVEPQGASGEAEHLMCLNCGTALIGAHCHRCGQSGHVHRSLSGIGHEILHGVVHLDGKLWHTLPLLAWRPGELTRRYIAGERARFVSPMALFLFSIFTMFAVLQIMGVSPPAEIPSDAVQTGIQQTLKELDEDRADAVEKRARLDAGDARIAKLDARIAEMNKDERALRQALPSLAGHTGRFTDLKTGWHRLDKGIEKANQNPGLALYKLQTNSYKFSWLLIPISIPFVWLLFFWRRDLHLYDHMVFITYSIAAMSLLFIVLTIASGLGLSTTPISLIALGFPVWHIYRQLKGAYRLSRASAVLRTSVLLGLIAVILGLFGTALLTLGLLG